MANQALIMPNRALDANAYVSAGAKATFYRSGTNTLITVYSDDGDPPTVTSNPVTADPNGVFPQTFYDGDARVVVTDENGATLWTLDPVPATSGDATGAANVTFSPTVDLPQTNVQAAIEAAAALAISGVADFGIGITGNAPTISNVDSAATASGIYRFTGSSTGTFPSGVTASTTGLVRIDRQTANEAIMYLRAAGGTRFFVRHLVAGAWGAWQGQIDNVSLVTSSETIGANDNDTTVPTSAAVIDYVPVAMNANGSAPMFACRAWGNFNGTGTPAFRASGNCASITDLGAGTYRITMTTALEDTNYVVVVSGNSGGDGSAGSRNDFYTSLPSSTTEFLIYVYDLGGVNVDSQYVQFAVFR